MDAQEFKRRNGGAFAWWAFALILALYSLYLVLPVAFGGSNLEISGWIVLFFLESWILAAAANPLGIFSIANPFSILVAVVALSHVCLWAGCFFLVRKSWKSATRLGLVALVLSAGIATYLAVMPGGLLIGVAAKIAAIVALVGAGILGQKQDPAPLRELA